MVGGVAAIRRRGRHPKPWCVGEIAARAAMAAIEAMAAIVAGAAGRHDGACGGLTSRQQSNNHRASEITYQADKACKSRIAPARDEKR